MIRVALCVLCVLSAVSCQRYDRVAVSSERISDAHALELRDVEVLMSIMGVPQRYYTVQGVLENGGTPVTGQHMVNTVLLQDGAAIPDGSASMSVEFDLQGRFTARIPLDAAPEPFASDSEIGVQVSIFENGGYVAVGDPLPLDFAPRAYAAVYAETAGEVADVETIELEPYFNDGWTNFGFDLEHVRATRRGNMVFLEGAIENTGATSTVMLTLPEGFHPVKRHFGICWGLRTTFGGHGPNYRVDVFSNGWVALSSPDLLDSDFISLNGLYFSLD